VRIAILGQPDSWHVGQLKGAAESAGHSVVVAPYARLTAAISTSQSTLEMGGVDLLDCDRALIRSVPPGSLEQVIFRMDAIHRLEAKGVPTLNPARAIEACVDKYLATAKLAAAGLPVPRTMVCEDIEQAFDAFRSLGRRVVVKPLFGSEGRGILAVESPALAERVFRSLFRIQAVLYLQEYIDHPGHDIRVLTLGDRPLAAMRRRGNADFRTNIAMGGTAEPFVPSDECIDLALRASRAIGAPFAGVDLLPGPGGELHVIEVNSSPGFKALAQTTSVDIPGAIIRYLTSGG
jgi:RimK family alpha-L-glutamate ligase